MDGSWRVERQAVVGENSKSAEGGEGGGGVVMILDAGEGASIYRPEADREHLGLAASIERN